MLFSLTLSSGHQNIAAEFVDNLVNTMKSYNIVYYLIILFDTIETVCKPHNIIYILSTYYTYREMSDISGNE
jgi:hypothetical protein